MADFAFNPLYNSAKWSRASNPTNFESGRAKTPNVQATGMLAKHDWDKEDGLKIDQARNKAQLMTTNRRRKTKF